MEGTNFTTLSQLPALRPIRGREGELAVLKRHFSRLRDGVGACWLIEGKPGTGKTRLMEQAAAMAAAREITAVHGAADPDATIPLGALTEALCKSAIPTLDRPELSAPVVFAPQRYWLIQDMQSLLERTALLRPMLVCLDDLQWADSGTLAAIRSLPARLASLPIGWILAFRPPDPDSDLARTAAALARAGADVTSLGRLSPSAVAEIAADVLGAVPGDDVLAMCAGMQGNPFRLIELLVGLRDERMVDIRDGRALLTDLRLPSRVRTSMRRRLGELTPAARKVALVGASLGRRFTVAQLAAVLDEPVPSLLDPVSELIDRELFAEVDRALAFSHDLNREAVRASQPPTAAAVMDRKVAVALLKSGALPVEVATRLAAGAEKGDEVAIATLARAADSVASVDPGQGADLARRALDLTGAAHPLRGPLVGQVALLLHAAGRSNEAMAFADGALSQALPPDQEADVHLSIASLFSISPELRAQSCRRALSLSGLTPGLYARLHAQLFYNLVVAVRTDEAAAQGELAREAVTRTQDDAAWFSFDLARSALAFIDGQLDASLEYVESALQRDARRADGAADPRRWLARHFRSGILVVMDRSAEARATVAEGIRAAQRARQHRALQLFEGNQARQQLQLGLLADAAATLEGRFTPDDASLVVSVLDADAVVVLGRVAIHTGDRRQAALAAAVARGMLGSGIPGVERHAAWLLALQADAAGDPVQARGWLAACGETERLSVVPLFPFDPADDPRLVRIALASGDTELARVATASAERRAIANPGVPGLMASAAYCRGLLDGNRDRLAEAVSILASVPESARRRLFLAAALEDLAAAALRDVDAEEAVSALDHALGLYAACGATADLGRVRRSLRDLGVTRRRVTEPPAERGWATLTESELVVVRLVADGLTNREVAERLYVSPHTVSGHLRHAFTKLDIRSRIALSRIVSEHEADR